MTKKQKKAKQIDKRAAAPTKPTPEPQAPSDPVPLPVEVPEGCAGREFVKWLRMESARLKAKRVLLPQRLYDDFRQTSHQRSSVVSWANGSGLCVVVPAQKGTVEEGQACFE